MLFEIIKQLLSFHSVSTDLIINPEIEDQPRIQIYELHCNSEDVEKKEKKHKFKTFIDRILTLDFSIRYEIPEGYFISLLTEQFKKEDKIFLRKFRRKTFYETYFFAKSKEIPKEIKLPKPDQEKFKDHRLWIFNFFLDKNFNRTKKGSLYFTIFIEVKPGTVVTQSLLREAVINFRSLLEIEKDDPNQYAYQFSIETVTNGAILKGMPSRKVYTNMFKVVFDRDGCGIKAEYVDPRYYHLD